MKKIFLSLLLLVAVCVSAQEVPTSFPRKYLIEHFTGDQCGYCPAGMFAITDYVTSENPSTIWVSHHYGYNTDEYTINESSYISKMLSVSGAPNMALNRKKQMGTAIAFHPGYLPDLTITDDTVAEASVIINHTYNAETRQLDVTVSGQVGNPDATQYLLSVLIKENGLVGKQSDYQYAWKGSSWKEFLHPRVARDFITAHFGDTVYVDNQTYSKTWSYTLNEEWIPENCCVVAFLTPLAKKPVINAEQVVLVEGTTGGEHYYPIGITDSQAPNKPDALTFDTIVSCNKPSDDKLVVTFYNKTSVKSTGYGAVKSLLTLEFNTTENALPIGTFDILSDNTENTLASGTFDKDNATFGGSLFQYVQVKAGDTIPCYTWRINTGKIQIEENGNITLAGNFYNGKHYTITITGASIVTNVENTTIPQENAVEKLLRNGQVVIRRGDMEYTILGNTL